MRRHFPILPLLALSLFSFSTIIGQTALLKDFRFEDGGYTLAGIRSESDKNALADSLGDFYTDDIAVLNAIKKAWVFRRPNHQYACGYHYYIIILKDGKKIKSHSINLNCHELTTENGSLYFDSRLLSMFKNRVKKLYLKTSEFNTLKNAREFWTNSHNEKSFVYADAPNWLKHEGSFGFVYICPDKCPNFTTRDKYTEPVRLLIARTYPGSEFELRQNGGSSNGEIYFEVQSNWAFYDKFDLYKLDRESYFHGKWKPYPLNLYSYWKTP